MIGTAISGKALLIIGAALVAGYLVLHGGVSNASGAATGSSEGQALTADQQPAPGSDASSAGNQDDAIAALLASLGNQNGELEQQLLAQAASFNTGYTYGTQTSGAGGGGGFTYQGTQGGGDVNPSPLSTSTYLPGTRSPGSNPNTLLVGSSGGPNGDQGFFGDFVTSVPVATTGNVVPSGKAAAA